MDTLNNSVACEICGNDPAYKVTNAAFRPVQCTEAMLKDRTPINGFLYFAIDSKKIYLGKEGQFLPMGGNSGIYYGLRTPEEGESDSEDVLFPFAYDSEIEGNQIPNVNDLILNTPDGCFYRVQSKDDTSRVLIAEKLTIAGSGGSGGTGGGGGSKPNILGLNDNKTYYGYREPETMHITFTGTSVLTENNYIDVVEYKIGAQTFYMNDDWQFGETIDIDFSQHLDILNTQGSNTITILIQDAWGNRSTPRPITIKIYDLQLTTNADSIIPFDSATSEIYYYNYTPMGGNDRGLTRYLDLTIAPIDNPGNIIYNAQPAINSLNAELPEPINLSQIENIRHGVYILTATYRGWSEQDQALINSNTLTHQLLYLADSATPLIASDFVDGANVLQYSKFTLKYIIAEGSEIKPIKVKIYTDDNNYSPEDATLNKINEWTYTFANTGVYTLFLEYNGLKQRLGKLNVIDYGAEDIPQVNTQLCELNLIAAGKTNTQSNREEWTWQHGSNVYAAKFDNFLWGSENGWLEDSDGEPSLKLTNGAKLTIPNYFPFAADGVATGLTIEVDFKLSNILNYNKPLITCLSNTFKLDDNGDTVVDSAQVGFQITGQKATLNSAFYKATTQAIQGEEDSEGNISESDMALQALTQYFNEDTRIHLTYVIEKAGSSKFNFVYTYVNGVLSGIMKLDANDKFVQNDRDPAIFTFDSTFGDIYIYSIRTVRQALNPNLIIDHWMADINNIDRKIELAQANKVFNMYNRVDKSVIDAMSTTLGVPYVVFEGGIPMPKKFKKKNLTDPDNDIKDGGYHPDGYPFSDMTHKLPVTKSDYRLMSVHMYSKDADGTVKPMLEVPIELEDASNAEHKVSNFNDIKSTEKYWFNRGVQVYGQGTSSMVYPVKNLRLKFIKKDDFPTVYTGSVPVEIVCFKADYMDSAASHNTCTGNLVYDLYQELGMKTPPQVFGGDYDIVTAIKGFPIICFYKNYDKPNGNNDEYLYIGRYNFNLDKATPEPFGFPGMYRKTGEKVTDDQGRTRDVVEVCGLLTEEVSGKTVLPMDSENKEKKIDIAQCWEVLNNDTNSPTKFLTPVKADGSRYINYRAALEDCWADYYEDRYPDEIVGLYEDGELASDPFYSQALENGLFRMSTWVNSTALSEANPSVELAAPVYYKTLDEQPAEGVTYYNAEHQEVTLRLIDAIDYQVNNSMGSSIERADVSINSNTFITKVNNEHGTYTFSYNEAAWSLFQDGTSILVELSDYGITVAKAVAEGQSIIVDLFSTWDGWTPSNLYERHTHDTQKYRLAKFKNEFTEYFDMDFSTFYYVLTLTLLMMDSRAKNMMLASWDTRIWYPIFYDMDTMLGLNNTGFNKFSYDTEDDPADKVFNGFDSVLWNNFRSCFTSEIAKFYTDLRAKMTFQKLMDTYNTKGANAWNEALMTQDAIYKYERPYEEGYYDGKEGNEIKPGQISYLYAAQGRRSNHRAWWLKNRLNYLDSKYKPTSLGGEKPSQSETFSFRAYGLPSQKSSPAALACVEQTPASHRFTLTALANSYQSIFIGNIVYGPEYTYAGQEKTLGPDSPKHEVESYILNPSLIADLGDLSDKYIGSWNMPANKLTALRFGRSSRSHPGAYDKYFNSLLTALNIGDTTPYLNYLNVARCTGLPTLDLSTCNKLEILDAEGAKMTAVTFPVDSILKELYLPKTLKTLIIKNQPHLDTIVFDSTGTLILSALELIGINKVNTYPIVKEVFSIDVNTIPYILTDVNWYINDFTNNNVTSIPILDTLIHHYLNNGSFKPATGYNLASAITGEVTIDGTPGNNIVVNEFDLYNLYKKYFPNLIIKFGENVTLTEAARIKFISDDNNTVYYEVLTDSSKSSNLAYLVSDDGPNGVELGTPSKPSTEKYDYEFSHYWKDLRSTKYYNDFTVPADFVPEAGAVPFSSVIPEDDMEFYADYISTKRYYTVTFRDDKGNMIYQVDDEGNNIEAWPVQYEREYDGPMKNYYYKDESKLNLDKKYTFQGWGTAQNAVKPTFVNPESLIVTSSITLYAYFKEELVNTSPVSYDFLSISSSGALTIKDNYKNELQGKITLPAKDINGKIITSIGLNGLANMKNVTHLFFEKDSAYKEIGNSACRLSSFKYVDLPQGLLTVGDKAFEGCANLETIILPDSITRIGVQAFAADSAPLKVKINKLPASLTELGDGAFWNAGPNITISHIPSGVRRIPMTCFFACTNLTIAEFGIDSGEGGLETIEDYAFFSAGTGVTPDFNKVIFKKSVKSVALDDGMRSPSFKSSYLNNPAIEIIEIHNADLYALTQDAMSFTGDGESAKIQYVP